MFPQRRYILPYSLNSKESACNTRDPASIPGSGRSSGGGNDTPLQYSCLENIMDRGAGLATMWDNKESDMTEQLKQKNTYRWSTDTWKVAQHNYQFSSVTQLCLTLCDPTDCSMPGFPVHQLRSLLKFMSIESVMPSNHLILCHPLLPPSISPSIRVFSSESVLHIRWPNYWSFSFSISPFNEHPGLISFRMDWLDLLAVQGTLKSLLQRHSSKASILQCSAFFTAQLSHTYMTNGKTIALTRRTFVDKVRSLLFSLDWS